MPAVEIRDLMEEAGFSTLQAEALDHLFGTFTATRTPFDYATSFPAVDPNCVAAFLRSFHHQDWVDGESPVQAEQTTGEDGFNLRFHRIEQDLDRLAADVSKAFVCMAAMRASLRLLLDEIRTELNRLGSATPPDLTPPVVSAVEATAISGSGATITWTTNEPADTQVEYGTTTNYGSSTPLNPALVTNHSVQLTGLSDRTPYHYQVKSKDAAGNPAVSADFTFTTPDVTAPVITGVDAQPGRGSAEITWTTDEAADSQVQFRATGTAQWSQTTLQPDLVTEHVVELIGLGAQRKTYQFRVRSRDAAGNLTVSGISAFQTEGRD